MTEETIFAAALERRTPEERAAFLDDACSGDEALRRRVEALLGALVACEGFLEVPAIDQVGLRSAIQAVANEASTAVASSESDEDELALDFLGPASEPGSIGSLGHYEVAEVVGRGGMGIVLRAVDTKLNRVVAIKVLARELAASASARRRFIREARAAAAVCHEHVVTIHAVEEAHRPPFLVMQYVDGGSLQQKLDRQGPLKLAEVLRIGMQTALGLAAAHAQGLVHRDIKPANILLENGVERVKITDFGLARAVDDASLTQSGFIAGTPMYMSPEQAEGHALDHRSDLFSLGSVLYAACTGRSPFRAPTAVAVLRRVCDDTPRPIRDVNNEVPDWLAAIIDRLLAKQPGQRFESASEVALLLGRCLAATQRAGPLPEELIREIHALSGGRSPEPEPAAAQAPGNVPRHTRRWLLAAVVLLLSLAGAGLSEAVGVTHVAGSVVHLLRPEGTLVIEADSPGVHVSVGDEEVVISGTGPQQVRLKTGQYWLEASKNGQLVRRELVEITRGGRRLVRVSQQPPAQPAESSQVSKLASALKALNPGFDGRVGAELENREVSYLELCTDDVTDLAPVRTLSGLKDLRLRGTRTDMGKLASLEALRPLHLNNVVITCNPVHDLSPLAGMRLTSFCSMEAPIHDLAPLAGQPISHLTVWLAPLQDLSPLRGMKLRYLNLRGLPVVNISALAEMPLEQLFLNETGVRDLGPLRGMKLKGLELRKALIEDLGPLEGIPLRRIAFTGTPVRDISALAGMPLESVECDFVPERDARVLRAIRTLRTINGKPAAEFWKEVDVALAAPAAR